MRSSYIVSGSKVAEMTRLLERQGLNSSDLDDLVVALWACGLAPSFTNGVSQPIGKR